MLWLLLWLLTMMLMLMSWVLLAHAWAVLQQVCCMLLASRSVALAAMVWGGRASFAHVTVGFACWGSVLRC